MSDIFGASYLLICSIFFNIWNCRYIKMLLSYNIVIDIISKFRSEAIQLLLSLWYYLVQYSHRSLWYVSYGGKMSDIFFFDRVIVARCFVCHRKKVMSDIITVQSLLGSTATDWHLTHDIWHFLTMGFSEKDLRRAPKNRHLMRTIQTLY